MIRTTRTAFRELPNGNFGCVVEVELSRDMLGTALSVPLPCSPSTSGGDLPAQEEKSAEFKVELSANADHVTENADKPPAQTIGAGVGDTQEFMSPGMLETWKHPAAKKIRTIYLHPPFQNFAREELKVTDPFAAAIPTAINFMRKSVAPAQSVVEAQALLEKMIGDYGAWCELNGLVPWPEDVKA